jgi:hypothetical protein
MKWPRRTGNAHQRRVYKRFWARSFARACALLKKVYGPGIEQGALVHQRPLLLLPSDEPAFWQ